MREPICPCRDCPADKRKVGCHGTCEGYIEWKRIHEEIKAEIESELSVSRMLYDTRSKNIQSLLRRHGKKV